MSLSFIVAFAWGIALLCSLAGWGFLVERTLRARYADWGLRAAWGAALSITLGGLLNLLWLISPAILLSWIALGWLWLLLAVRQTQPLAALRRVRDALWRDKLALVASLAVALLMFVQYAATIANPPASTSVSLYDFNRHDDFHAYLVFPQKMLQTGALGNDPFSERRLTASLGGQYFLHALALSVVGEQNLHLIDPGLGLLLLLALLAGLCARLHLSPRGTLLALALALLIPLNNNNLTSALTGAAMYLALFRTLHTRGDDTSLRASALLALMVAGVSTLKSTQMPASGLLVALFELLRMVHAPNRRAAFTSSLAAAVLSVIFLLPWMVSLLQSSGTLLFPVLGRGYHGSVLGSFLMPTSELSASEALRIVARTWLVPYALGLIALGAAALRVWGGSHVRAWLVFGASTLLGSLIANLALGGFDTQRYVFPIWFASMLAFVALLLSAAHNKLARATAALVALVLIAASAPETLQQYQRAAQAIAAGLADAPLAASTERAAYARMQAAVPAGALMLTRMEKPFVLDFKRNEIWIADWPGAASLPPGMPAFKGSAALADYLLARGIRYVAYDYASEANFSKKLLWYRTAPSQHGWTRTEARHAFDFQDNLMALSQTRQRVYDDGARFVLDLATRAP